MPVIQELRKTKRTVQMKTQSRLRLRRLADGPQPSAALARAVDAVMHDRLEPAERKWADEIEALRNRILASDEPLGEDDDPTSGTAATKTLGQAAKGTSPRHWGLVLMKLVTELKPATCLEMGTSLGISAAYMSAGQMINGRGGRVITMEGSTHRAGWAKEHWAELGIDHPELVFGNFDDTLPEALESAGTVDYAFLDGNHEMAPTLRYTEEILQALSPRGVLLFDDIRWSGNMSEAWTNVSSDPRVEVALDLQKMGVCSYPGGTGHETQLTSLITRVPSGRNRR